MREDLPDWLGKPPLRGTDQWAAWLDKWRRYAKTVLRDRAADDPDYDYGLLSVEERWRVALRLQVQGQIEAGRQNGPVPMSLALGRKVSDLDHAGVVAWQVGRSVVSPIPDEAFTRALEWSNQRENPRRRRISHGIRYGFIAGLVVARLRGRLRGRVGARQRDRDRRRPAGISCGRPAAGQSVFLITY